ncbi:ATP-binding protein [Paenibacillus sp. FJAT-26967]|uniref:ATP-binding protein n=1 Tax=Paenibacillus sp. FJAT-26967 TaxID=1729690 RepID=UPI000837FF77|nr:ATP-binding protein [Paenibacillus sp. FJAT-26967]
MKEKKLFFIMFFLLCLMQTYFLWLVYAYPYIGAVITPDNNGSWVVSDFEKLGKGKALGIEIGDIVEKINGEELHKHQQWRLWKNIEQAERIEVKRGGEDVQIHIPKSGTLYANDLGAFIIEVLSFFLAAFLYVKAKQSQSAKYLILVFFTIGLEFMVLGASSRGDIWGKYLITTVIVIVPVAFLHFLITFFNERAPVVFPKRILHVLYGLAGIGAVLRIVYFSEKYAHTYYEYSNYTVIPLFLVGIISNIYFLFQAYRQLRTNLYMRSLIKSILYSLIICFFPFSFLSLLPMLIFNKELVSAFYTSWFILILPLSFAYFILSKKLYDIDLYLRRVLFTMLVSTLPSLLTVGFILFVYQHTITWIEVTFIFIIVLVIFSIFTYSMEYIATRLEKVMFPRKYFLQQSLKKISKALGTVSNFNALKEIILNDIVNALEIHGGAIVFVETDGIQVITAGNIDEEEVCELLEKGVNQDDQYTAFKINENEEYKSFLVLTGKKSNTYLGMEDRQWIHLIITYLSASLENVYLLRKLTLKMYELMANIPNSEATEEFVWLRKTMFEIQEKERMRIAMDLHDTTMQDLFLLKRRLHPILQRFPHMTDEYGQLTTILTHIDLINENLRQSCFELNPYLLQKAGLIGSIQKLVDVESAYCEFQLEFQENCSVHIELLDVERKKHLFRVVQELLNNAKKHSHAENVRISLSEDGGCIELSYEDDGVGFELLQKDSGLNKRVASRSGIGLDQMQGRVLLMDGDFVIHTNTGQGVRIEIRIPFLEGMIA